MIPMHRTYNSGKLVVEVEEQTEAELAAEERDLLGCWTIPEMLDWMCSTLQSRAC